MNNYGQIYIQANFNANRKFMLDSKDNFILEATIASGEVTKSESQGLGDYEFVPWQIGAVM